MSKALDEFKIFEFCVFDMNAVKFCYFYQCCFYDTHCVVETFKSSSIFTFT